MYVRNFLLSLSITFFLLSSVVFVEFSKNCAQRWKAMKDDEKKRFYDMAEQVGVLCFHNACHVIIHKLSAPYVGRMRIS